MTKMAHYTQSYEVPKDPKDLSAGKTRLTRDVYVNPLTVLCVSGFQMNLHGVDAAHRPIDPAMEDPAQCYVNSWRVGVLVDGTPSEVAAVLDAALAETATRQEDDDDGGSGQPDVKPLGDDPAPAGD